MKKVHISFLHNLEHLEFKIFYSSLLRLMQQKGFADSTLTELLERLQSHREDVGNLGSGVQKYKNTLKIGELSRLRTDYLISFRLEIKSKMLWYKPEMRLAAGRLYRWLKNYKKQPFIQSISTQNKVVDNMLWRIAKDKSLKTDIALLGLDELMDAIEETTQQIAMQVNQRSDEKMSRQKKGRDVRDAAYSEVKTLANYLEYKVSIIQGNVPDSEHYMLMLEMHQRLKDIRKDFRIRTAKDKTRRKKTAALKQLKADKQVKEIQTDCVNQSPQPKPSTITLTETLKQPATNGSLILTTIEAPKTHNKHKITKAKPKMSRRKIKKMLV